MKKSKKYIEIEKIKKGERERKSQDDKRQRIYDLAKRMNIKIGG